MSLPWLSPANQRIFTLQCIIQLYFPAPLTLPMQALQHQNSLLQKRIEGYFDDIQKQKELNAQHETEIQTLLKFNERLLGIIENQLNNNRKERDSLQPISERSERQSDIMVSTGHSLIRKRNFAAKSERGSVTSNSLAERTPFAGSRLENYARQLRSQLNYSCQDDSSEYRTSIHPPTSRPAAPLQSQASQVVQSELQGEIQHLKKLKTQGSQFYDSKIKEIKHLSARIANFQPLQHLSRINKRLNISAATSRLLQRALRSP